MFSAHPEYISKLKKDDGALLVWCDYMKCGRLSVADLNNTTELIKRALEAAPEDACAFLLGPQLTSERRGSLRDELRTVDCNQLLV